MAAPLGECVKFMHLQETTCKTGLEFWIIVKWALKERELRMVI
jgi:hypothetical protein